MKCTGNSPRSRFQQCRQALLHSLSTAVRLPHKYTRGARLVLAALALALLPAAQVSPAEAAATCTHAGSVVTCTYGFSGAAETWNVPPGVTQVAFQVVGAPGGRSGGPAFPHADGGRGADLKATLTLNPGTPVIITVGGPGGTDGRETGGFNGGGGGQYSGNSYAISGGGGGASDVRIGGAALADRILVAGGGGGGGAYGEGNGPGSSGGPAGGAGGDAGAAGAAGTPSPGPTTATPGGGGGAGTTAAGGAGGTAGKGYGGATGAAGALGQGGAVADNLSGGGGGGGGGGVYGGGGGGAAGIDLLAVTSPGPGGGGGGGGASGYTSGLGIANVSLGVDTARVPKVVITYTDTTAPSVTVNQAAGQADPTGSNPVLFTAEFDEPVSGFGAAGVTLGGTANLSGAAVTVSGGPSVYSISVAGLAGSGTVTAAVAANAATDAAGNGNTASTSTDNTVTVNFDTTPPVITPNLSGTLGQNGWYVGNVSLTWTVSDPESSITSQIGCGTQNITADTTGVTFSCSATSAGGSDSKSVIVKRDATKPIVVSATPDRAPNVLGWYNAPLTVAFDGLDATSGIAACTSPTYSGPDNAVANVSGTCTDNAGNVSSTVGYNFRYDATAPSTTATPNPAPNAAGWHNAPLQVTFGGTDATSGIAFCTAPDHYSGPDTTGLDASGTCNDKAGNTSAPATYTIKYDTAAPTVVSATPDRAPNAAGWYNAPVVVTFAGTDATSGIAACTSPTYSGPDSATANVSGTCTDNAGNTGAPVAFAAGAANTGQAVSFSLKYDATAPVLNPAVSPNPVVLNVTATATPNAADATSGVASSSCVQPDTTTGGAKNVNCTATDNAGNTATGEAAYTVVDDAPTIAVAPGGTCADARAGGTINLIVGDANTGPAGLTLRVVTNTNPQLVPDTSIVFGGTGANRTMTVTAAPAQSGTATITAGVSDGANETTLVVTIIAGTGAGETITGTAGPDLIFGLAGANTIDGLGGNDLLCGGIGVDTLIGGEGSDTLYGGLGDDTLTGSAGADFFSGGPGTDTATDYTPAEGDTKDATVENLAPVDPTADPVAGEPVTTTRLYLPAITN